MSFSRKARSTSDNEPASSYLGNLGNFSVPHLVLFTTRSFVTFRTLSGVEIFDVPGNFLNDEFR